MYWGGERQQQNYKTGLRRLNNKEKESIITSKHSWHIKRRQCKELR